MGLFKRARPEPPPDSALPLTIDGAARLRALVREAFAESGVEVVVLADHVVDDQGHQFGLWNLAALCRDAPESEWGTLVRTHVANLGRDDDLEQLADAELVGATYLRLVETASLPDRTWHPNATAYGEDLTALLSVDLPHTVSTPREEFWVERGGLHRWLAIGRDNLAALVASAELEHQEVGPEDGRGRFDVVMGESFFTGSTALLVDDLVRRFRPDADLAHGVLVVAPFRHQVAFRVLDGTPDGALSLNNMFGFAVHGFADAPGPLSQNVFWVRGDRWVQVSRIADGQATVEVDEELGAALGG